MARASKPAHYVVDGSNIATEGRSAPSLAQLDEAVRAFMADHPDAVVTVVVDATFGHRISPKEQKAFDAAVANNELVTPPAGAVGRGDAFVLTIADKAGAGVLSNDSFQEFHGKYPWLFDSGRLIGGKPVPHVGWVFVERSPVRGPKSRQATREAAKLPTPDQITVPPPGPATASPSASPSPSTGAETTPKRGRSRSKRAESGTESRTDSGTESSSESSSESAAEPPARRRETSGSSSGTGPSRDQVNSRLPFLEFVAQHPVGTSCTGVVESYSSHGAYARVGDVLVYIPLRLMDNPPPRSARSVLKVGEAVTVVIVDYVGERLSIDAALPHMAAAASSPTEATQPTVDAPVEQGTDTSADEPAKRRATKRGATKQVPEPTSAESADAADAGPAPAEKRGAKKAPAKKTPAKKAPAKKAPAKKAAAGKAPAKKAPAKKAAAKKAPAKKTPAKKAAAKKAPAKKAPASPTGEEGS